MTNAYHYSVAVIAGDGIGQEVMPVAQHVVEEVASIDGFTVTWNEFPWSCAYYQAHGAMMPQDGIDRLREHDAILLGAVGDPSVPDHVSLWGLLMPIRRAFDQYVNLRPARLLPGVDSPLRDTSGGIDVLLVRENTEGEYSRIGGRHLEGTAQEFAVQEAVFTRAGTTRIIDYAARLAATRTGRLHAATKSNGIVHTMPFWDEIFGTVLSEHPEVHGTLMHVDALAARMVSAPGDMDVVVGSNLFGDILSDLAAAVVGSLGVAPSANLNPEGEHPSMFEPVHGSAPDIAGRGIANPIGQIWSAAMLLDHLGQTKAHDRIVRAIEQVTALTSTPDLGGSATTREVGDAVVAALTS